MTSGSYINPTYPAFEFVVKNGAVCYPWCEYIQYSVRSFGFLVCLATIESLRPFYWVCTGYIEPSLVPGCMDGGLIRQCK